MIKLAMEPPVQCSPDQLSYIVIKFVTWEKKSPQKIAMFDHQDHPIFVYMCDLVNGETQKLPAQLSDIAVKLIPAFDEGRLRNKQTT